ncbi:MAG: MBL fold metallo-hydrolase [Oscillospiraceae bacterium]
MQITVLMENGSREGLCAEHGLSLYVRYGDGSLLLDAGESGDFVHNARQLGCPLYAVHTAVLSHGHYDHADGFPALFRLNDAVKVYARPAVLEPQYSPDGRYIGLNTSLREEYAGRFDLSDEMRSFAPGLWLVPDEVDHEQSLVAETENGLVVMNSCCHAGADNIVAGVLERFPGKRVRALVGGLHLMGPGGVSTLGMDPDGVRALARRLTEELGVEEICTGHCTGAPGLSLLEEAAPGKVRAIHAGDILEF